MKKIYSVSARYIFEGTFKVEAESSEEAKCFIWEYLISLKAVFRYHAINECDDSTPLSSLRWDTEQ